MKRNNALPNNHFKKTSKRIKTWFDQPANKERRRSIRLIKAKKIFPMPLEKLRPIVRCPTIRYNKKERLGRGFTPEECKAAGLNHIYARTIGISIDLKRRNMNQETFDQNVQRLIEYQSKIKIFKTKSEAKGAIQHMKHIMPIVKNEPIVEVMNSNDIINYN
ncbi:ribosomal protein L13E [Enterocytozoon bieneusi H348]|nr:ribosomal protein L13E [Enterocytozoon bieneusi H348]|eukprot:XP_001827927.1 ribosomal protein L13E [Enterocytozoon bieneusi H348]